MTFTRRHLLKMGVTGSTLIALNANAEDKKEQAEDLPYRLISDVMVKTRDGVELATDIYLPLTGDKFPVVIERTPYGKTKLSRSELRLDGSKIQRAELAGHFTKLGIAVIYQDCRGRYNSGGEFIKYTREGEDGFDTYEWILQQPWCDGRIGSMGLSYAAHTQMAAACLKPKGLVTMVLDSGGFHNAYQCGIRQGGAFELKQATWAYRNALASPLAIQNPDIKKVLEAEDITEWFKKMPWKPGESPVRHHPEYEDYLFKLWTMGEFSDYWKQVGLYAEGFYDSLPDIPVLFMSSWYDAYVPTTLSNYLAFAKSPRKAKSHLIMGSWLHGDRNVKHSGDVDFGDKSPFDGNLATGWLEYRLDWFATQFGLKAPSKTAPVSFFVMGGGSGRKDAEGRMQHGGFWKFADTYPLPNSEMQRFYLSSKKTLAQTAEKNEQTLDYISDPKNPVPTIGGAITSGKPVMVGGAFDQVQRPDFFGTSGDNSPIGDREDILVFETEPLAEDLILAGDVKIKLFIRSDAPDTDFTAKLIDVYPPNEDYPQGFAMNITDGIFRCRYRKSWEKAEILKPDEIAEITIEPFQSCNVFKKGHKLRLDIASSNFPHFDVNPQTGEPEGMATSTRIAKNEVFCGGEHASYLELMIVKS